MDDDIVTKTLNELIEGCNANAAGFRRAARKASTDELRTLLESRADQCEQAANKLQLEVERAGGQPAAGAAGGRTDLQLLEQCEQSDDDNKRRYEKALQQPLPEPIMEVVRKQHDAMDEHHREIREQRDRLRAAG